MLSFIQNIPDFLVLVVMFGITIFVHELGHFLAARWFGMVIDTFSIGFGPAIWKKKVNGTTYKIAWIPIGGYVALPAYEGTLQRTRRSEAREALSDFAARQEQYFLDNKSYSSTISALGRSATTENGYYVVSIGAASTLTYTLRATAQAPQNKDTDCVTMEFTSRGNRTPADCW